MTDYFQKQYGLVRDSRTILLDFIDSTLGDAGMNVPLPAYPGKSIRDMLVHSASCYIHWLPYLALRQPQGSVSAEGATIGELRQVYARVDETMALFLEQFSGSMDIAFNGVHDDSWRVTVTPHELFTHVTTHEFHHKGQIVLMARMLGHAPPDTDVSNSFVEQAPA